MRESEVKEAFGRRIVLHTGLGKMQHAIENLRAVSMRPVDAGCSGSARTAALSALLSFKLPCNSPYKRAISLEWFKASHHGFIHPSFSSTFQQYHASV